MIKMLIAAALVCAPIAAHAGDVPENVTNRGILAAACSYGFAAGITYSGSDTAPVSDILTLSILSDGAHESVRILIDEARGDEAAADYMTDAGLKMARSVDSARDFPTAKKLIAACYDLVSGE